MEPVSPPSSAAMAAKACWAAATPLLLLQAQLSAPQAKAVPQYGRQSPAVTSYSQKHSIMEIQSQGLSQQ